MHVSLFKEFSVTNVLYGCFFPLDYSRKTKV